MRDYELETLIRAQLLAGLVARGYNVPVKQNNQSRQQVAAGGPAVYFSVRSPGKPYGWPQRSDAWNNTTQQFEHTEVQVIHTPFTVAACVPNISPNDPTPMTSGDLIRAASQTLQHNDALAAFIAAGCNVFRVTDLPGVWFETSNEQQALWASFDIIFTHKDVFKTPGNVISDFAGHVSQVP